MVKVLMVLGVAVDVKRELLKLLREDEEFRYAVLGLLGLEEILKAIKSLQEQVADLQRQVANLQKQFVTLQEQVAGLQKQFVTLQKQVASLQKQVADLQKQFVTLEKQVASLQEQVAGLQKQFVTLQEQVASLQKQFVTLEKHVAGLQEQMVRLSGTIAALGMRYGVLTEEVFRDAIKYLVEDLLKVYKVEKWTYYDKSGRVFNAPSIVEVDVLVRDGEHILVEYKAHIDRSDVTELFKIGELYAEVTGVKPRLLIVGPTAVSRALKLAEELKVDVRTEYVFQ